ncbi:hypothetical protein PIB30_066610 [Stylosanthes scabra]|uniref:ABC transporter domain-containing protein n=1 Tax=Stylosanthes scabra TaxID=79078 RepID=A0ABU6RMQ2_9FABA|nr:hypothetical protein [Stylosanthes scabra]
MDIMVDDTASLSANRVQGYCFTPSPVITNRGNDNQGEKIGIAITWENLEVTVTNGKEGKQILHGLTGYAQPGKLLALMGPSGCGKSTLLDALSGRLSTNMKRKGKILINGHKQSLAYGTSGYVTQEDAMLSTLTAGETLYYSAQLQFPDSMSAAEKKERADITLREMGLQDAINTRVGGWGAKGLSGGQKRRLSICIEILTRPRLLFLDEPTSGLDSAASYYVMSGIAHLSQRDGIQRTIVTSIHQPSSEVFDLFHDLCLLSSGETVYFGPASDANQFFASNGFPCPILHNPSDHFLRIINKDFNEDIEQGFGKGVTTEEAIDILVKSYKSSKIRDEVLYEVAKISESGRGSMLGFTLNVLAFLTLVGGLSPLIEEMKVFERERLNGHYGVSAFLIGNILSAVPFMLVTSLIPGGIIYYLAGMHKGVQHFVYFIFVLFGIVMWVESLMMVIGSILSNFLMGIVVASAVEGLSILTCGFYRLPNDLPNPVWKYPLYYVSFLTYALQGLFKNEFEGLTFVVGEEGSTRSIISGRDILTNTWQVEMKRSKWVDLAIMFGMIVVYRVVFLGITKSKEKLKPVVASIKCSSQTKVFATGSAIRISGQSDTV